MLLSLKEIRQSFFKVGLREEHSFERKSDIILVNEAVFTIGIVLFSIAIIDLFVGFYARACLAVISFVFLTTVYFFQRVQKFLIAKLIIIGVPILTILSVNILFGTKSLNYFYLLATFCLSLVIFHKDRQHIISIGIHLISLTFILLFSKNYPPIFPGEDSGNFGFMNVFCLMILIYLVIKYFNITHTIQKDKISEMARTLNEKNQVLETQNAQITEQSAALEDTNAQLREIIEDYKITHKKLKNSNEELAQFAYAASHDLKEPLRTIGSFSQLVTRKLNGNLDPAVSEYLNFMVDGTKRMTALLDDLLNFSRLNREMEKQEVDLNLTIELIANNLRQLMEKNKGSIQTPVLPKISANQTQITQLFQNLISNGLKFKKEGILPEIEIGYQPKDVHHLFWVKDNGIGIDKDFQEKIFIIFQRLHQKHLYEGTGIGLAICKKVVHNHGGQIWVESGEKEGSTFYFTVERI